MIRVELIENHYTKSSKEKEVILMNRKPEKGEVLDLGRDEKEVNHYFFRIDNIVYNPEINSYYCLGCFKRVFLEYTASETNEVSSTIKYLFNHQGV